MMGLADRHDMVRSRRSAVSLVDVLAAHQVVQRHAWRTPLVPSAALSQAAGCRVYLKMECWQHTGSFKLRGALHKLSALAPDEWERGIVTASAGNHGLGVAYASQALDLPPATIFVPESAPQAKIERLRTLTCEIRRAGADYDATHAIAEAHAQDLGAVYVSAYDDPVVIAAQGTVALEVMEDLPDADLLLVPVGGGGLIAGAALSAKAINPAVRVVGVQPEASPAAYLSLREGRPYETYPAGPTICDGLAGGFGRVPFEIAGSLIDEILVVPEADVRRSVAWLAGHEQVIAEGSAAIAIAPLLNGQLDAEGQQVAAVLTGRNIDATMLQQILAQTNT
jgi:threonine dehydratase